MRVRSEVSWPSDCQVVGLNPCGYIGIDDKTKETSEQHNIKKQ